MLSQLDLICLENLISDTDQWNKNPPIAIYASVFFKR